MQRMATFGVPTVCFNARGALTEIEMSDMRQEYRFLDPSGLTGDTTPIPRSLSRDRNTTIDEKGLLAYLLTYAGQLRTFEQIAADFPIDGPANVRTWLESLTCKGYLTSDGDTWQVKE
jgi:hypothetical protein